MVFLPRWPALTVTSCQSSPLHEGTSASLAPPGCAAAVPDPPVSSLSPWLCYWFPAQPSSSSPSESPGSAAVGQKKSASIGFACLPPRRLKESPAVFRSGLREKPQLNLYFGKKEKQARTVYSIASSRNSWALASKWQPNLSLCVYKKGEAFLLFGYCHTHEAHTLTDMILQRGAKSTSVGSQVDQSTLNRLPTETWGIPLLSISFFSDDVGSAFLGRTTLGRSWIRTNHRLDRNFSECLLKVNLYSLVCLAPSLHTMES